MFSLLADLTQSAPTALPLTEPPPVIVQDPTPPASPALTVSPLQFSSNVVTVTVTNNTDAPVTLKWLTMTFPTKNGNLKQIKIGSATILNTTFAGPSVLISGFAGTTADRTIGAGQSTTLTFVFSHNVDTSASSYLLHLNFGTAGAVDVLT